MRTLATSHFTHTGADVLTGAEHIDRQAEMKNLAFRLLGLVGENPERSGLLETPARFAKAWDFFTSGYTVDSAQVVGNALFEESSGELVLIRNIEFFSLCEHHLVPFFGKAHVAYIPNGKVIGLSKIPRLVDMFSRRLQVQERLTQEIAREIEKILQPKGVAVITEASHLCMMMRGVEKQNSTTLAKSTLGDFATRPDLRAELMALL
jgi:GTP cyclohydrolase I